MSNHNIGNQYISDQADHDTTMRSDYDNNGFTNGIARTTTDLTDSKNNNSNNIDEKKDVPAAQPTNQQKRQNSNSLGMSGAIKRSVTQPNSPSFLISGNVTPNQQPLDSSRATAGTLTPALTQHYNQTGQFHHPTQHQHPLQQQQQQQQQMAPFKATFNIPSPSPNVPAKSKKFSTTFVNNTFQKSRTPDSPHSPSLSANKTKFDTSSYLNDDHTETNDFTDANSLGMSQTTAKPGASTSIQQPFPTQQNQQHHNHSQQQHSRQTILTKEANPDSPGSTISETSTTAPSQPAPNPSLGGAVGPVPTQTSKLSEEEQALILKLQDTYKTIIRLETDLQRKCQSLNLPQRLDMTELWDIYNTNITLLNSYYDFLLYSLSSGRSGKQIVQVYRIPRRLWVYGIVTFLDVLKNVVSIFIEHDICSSFIGYSFNILSGLTDLEMEGWVSEKLGDLSRMAIALYPSRYIDWKISSEFWYTTALKTQYGFGKIYYHIATVQQDNLDALVNIGKSVFCRDTFVPTPQYMRMVIDNINQRNFVDLPVVDFIKVHKILLSSEFNSDLELIKLVSYYSQNIGIDNNKVDFFVRTKGVVNEHIESPGYNQDNDYENKLNFWFQRSSSFALVNICQVVGFGNSANPFARLFGLVEALKERKDRKEKKDKRKKSVSNGDQQQDQSNGTRSIDIDSEDSISSKDLSVEEWFQASDYINKNALELAMRMFANYLNGPIITSTPHVITYLYFIISIGEALRETPTAASFFEFLLHAILPRKSLVVYLNEVLDHVRKHRPEIIDKLEELRPSIMSEGNFINYFNKNENLTEVWKCWGTLWYDQIQIKEDFANFRDAGIQRDDFLDVPIGGVRYNKELNNDRYTRILLLASYIADEFNFGLKRGVDGFQFAEYAFENAILRSDVIKGTVHNFLRDSRIQGLNSPIPETLLYEKSSSANITSDVISWLRSKCSSARTSNDSNQSGGISYVTDADNEADYDEEEDDREQLLSNQIGDDNRVPGNIGIGMDSSLSFFVLDTNMWLKHCGKIFKSVRSHIFRLAVPLVVFQELRSLRRSPDGNIADAAVRAVITVRQLASEGCVLALKLNGTEAPSLNDIKDFENNSTWMNSIDDSIIESSRLLDINANNLNRAKNAEAGNNTNTTISFSILVTEDRNMRLKARTKLVPAYQAKWFFQILEKVSNGRCND